MLNFPEMELEMNLSCACMSGDHLGSSWESRCWVDRMMWGWFEALRPLEIWTSEERRSVVAGPFEPFDLWRSTPRSSVLHQLTSEPVSTWRRVSAPFHWGRGKCRVSPSECPPSHPLLHYFFFSKSLGSVLQKSIRRGPFPIWWQNCDRKTISSGPFISSQRVSCRWQVLPQHHIEHAGGARGHGGPQGEDVDLFQHLRHLRRAQEDAHHGGYSTGEPGS